MSVYKTLVLLAATLSLIQSHILTGIIDNKGARGLDFSSTRVTLNGGEYTGFVDNMGNFKM
jgi:hypothetical protein